MKMWGGRFTAGPDDLFMEFSRSIGFDARLYPYDIRCTRAWAEALAGASMITAGELSSIESALTRVSDELDSGAFEVMATDEDIHTAVERRLVEIAGEAAGMVRAGRSRNDQVATDMRLFAMDSCVSLAASVKTLQSALLDRAGDTVDVIVPGHTHLQQAQPVLLAHALLAFVEMLQRDLALLDAARRSADLMPLGSAALAGTTAAVDREALASALGFSRISDNSLDAVSDRDFVCSLLFACSMIMAHLSRLAEQVVLWASSEWGLAELDESWSTGSSLMPQKKNPDGAELVRGKAGRTFGSLMAMLTVLKGLPLSYNRDLQEDKEGLFDAVDTTAGSLAVMAGTVGTMSFDAAAAARVSEGGFMTATDLADRLVEKGMSFPRAHEIVGRLVSRCAASGRDLSSLSESELKEISELLPEACAGGLDAESCIKARNVHGGTAREQVTARIADARGRLSD